MMTTNDEDAYEGDSDEIEPSIDLIYRECVTFHYWGSLGNGIGLIAKVDYYDKQTCIRWLPQSREGNPVAINPETFRRLLDSISEDRLRVGAFLTPNLNDE